MPNTTTVVNVKSGAPYDLYIGRENKTYGLVQSKWANPFRLQREEDRPTVLARYRLWLMSRPMLLSSIHELRGLTLACWCKPAQCHGDVLAELANTGKVFSGRQPAPWCLIPDDETRAYWAVEVSLNSVALPRLYRICQQQGWDYTATVEALR